MDKVLLLTSGDCDLQTRLCIEHLQSAMGNQIEHLRTDARGWTKMLAYIASTRRASRKVAVLHAWGYEALKLASFTSSIPLIYTPLAADPPRAARWLQALRSRRPVTVVSHSVGEDRWLVSRGIPPGLCQLVRPGVRMRRDLSRNVALRSELGLGEDHIAVLAVGESDDCSNHLVAFHASSILHEMDPRYVMVLWGRGEKAEAVVRRQVGWKSSAMANVGEIAPEVSYEDVIRACDLALLTAPSRIPLVPTLLCMAGNVPIVAPATPEISDVLEDHHTALLYSPLTARAASHRVVTAAEDPRLRQKLTDQARAESYELFPVSRYVSEMQGAYQRAADGQPSGK